MMVLTSAICVRRAQLTYIVNESCIKCKLMDCVEVCPVDCFYEGENMLVIHPDECIDAEKWLSINAQYAKLWPAFDFVGHTLPRQLRECAKARHNGHDG